MLKKLKEKMELDPGSNFIHKKNRCLDLEENASYHKFQVNNNKQPIKQKIVNQSKNNQV